MVKIILLVFLSLSLCAETYAAEPWLVTAYCPCVQCCGPKACGITASGKRVKPGTVAINWLPFGTKVRIGNLGIFTVEDRGAKSLFGSKKNHIKHVDVFMAKHSDALKFGKKYLLVEVLT